jgi:hypothetical protein
MRRASSSKFPDELAAGPFPGQAAAILRAVDLALVKASELGGRDRRAKDAEHRARVKGAT